MRKNKTTDVGFLNKLRRFFMLDEEKTETIEDTSEISDNLLDLEELEDFFSQLNSETDKLYDQREEDHEKYKSVFKRKFDKVQSMTDSI